MGIFGDIVGAVVDVAEDVGDAVVDVAEDVGDAVVDVVEGVGNAASGLVDGVVSVVEAVVDPMVQALEQAAEESAKYIGEAAASVGVAAADLGDWAASTAGDIASMALEPVLDVGDTFLSAVDDVGFFDAVDFVTVGLVDVNYDNNAFDMELGIEDVWGAGLHVGHGGVAADLDYGFTGVGGSYYDDKGFGVAASAGVDWGPLPSADGHLSVDEHGDLGVGARGEAYLPVPTGGFVGGEAEGDYQETADGFRTSGSLTARNIEASGTTVGVGVHGGYEEDKDGYHANVGVHAEFDQIGGPSGRVSVDYDEGRHGDVRTSGVSASGEVDFDGAHVGGQIGYTHVETSKGEFDVVDGTATVGAYGQEGTVHAAVASGPDGIHASAEVSGNSDLAAGAGDLLGQLPGAAGLELPDGLLPDDVGLPADLFVPGTDQIEGGLRDAVGDTLDEAVGDTVDGQVRQVLDDTVDEVFDQTVGRTLDEVGDTVNRAFDDTVVRPLEDVGDTVTRAFDDTVAPTFDDLGDTVDRPFDDLGDTVARSFDDLVGPAAAGDGPVQANEPEADRGDELADFPDGEDVGDGDVQDVADEAEPALDEAQDDFAPAANQSPSDFEG